MESTNMLINPRTLAKSINLLYKAWQAFVWGQPLAGLNTEKTFKPRYTESVFGFLERVFGNITPTPRYGDGTKTAHDCFAMLDALKLENETVLAQQKIADMLSLGFTTEDGVCSYDIRKYSRPITSKDAELMKEAFKEAIIVTMRFIDHRTLKISSETSKNSESFKLFRLYETASKAIETLLPLTDYNEEAYRYVYANTAIGNSVLYAYDQCYKQIAETKLEGRLGKEMLHLNDLTFPANTTALKLINYDIGELQIQIERELQSGRCVNVVDDCFALIDILEAIRSEYFRRFLDWSSEDDIKRLIEALKKQ